MTSSFAFFFYTYLTLSPKIQPLDSNHWVSLLPWISRITIVNLVWAWKILIIWDSHLRINSDHLLTERILLFFYHSGTESALLALFLPFYTEVYFNNCSVTVPLLCHRPKNDAIPTIILSSISPFQMLVLMYMCIYISYFLTTLLPQYLSCTHLSIQKDSKLGS